MFRKESFRVTNSHSSGKIKLKSVGICSHLSVLFLSFALFQESVKKLSRNFEYSKSQRAKKLSVLRSDLSFL